ncbi:MAG: DUF2207 family protein [Candidatus Woesearchaeota archaeon]
MKERSQIVLLVIILLIIGAPLIYTTIFYSQFTFYKSEISMLDSNTIEEKLYFKPDKAYHTLYRDFETPILPIYSPGINQIQIISVTCSHGKPYYEDNVGIQHIMAENPEISMTHTERNEYGCGFGDVLGFSEREEYFISARYRLDPDSLTEYNGKHYIKFVAYGKSRHPLLSPKTLEVTGDVIYPRYAASSSEFVMYIPYEPKDLDKYKIVHKSSLGTFNNILVIILYMLLAICPAMICFIIWYLFGKELKEEDMPEELSQYPKERKAWEVSVYFHPPFGDLDQNFLPTMILDFYHRKIIDIKTIKEGLIIKQPQIYIKILKPEGTALDDVDLEVMNFLKGMEYTGKSKGEYFCIKDISAGMVMKDGKKRRDFFAPTTAKSYYETLKKKIKDHSKEHISYTGLGMLVGAYIASLIILTLLIVFIGQASSILFETIRITMLVSALIIGIFYRKTSLFIRFKDDYYTEFQQWQGFKRYLSHLDTIPRTPYKGVVMWEKYLIYATALGVGKKVLEEMKKLNMINQNTYTAYSCIYTNTAFGSFSSSGGSGGGGMGGGGIGGGGGGGR